MYKLSTFPPLLLLSILFIFASCEKFSIPDDLSPESEGNLRVSVYRIGQTPFENISQESGAETRAGNPVSGVCGRLNFMIYDSSDTRLKHISQTSDSEDFGNCTFQLEEGTYRVVIVGHSSDGNPTSTDPSRIKFTNNQGYTDTFLYNGNVTIGEDPVDLNVELGRIVSLCRFVITDDFPDDVKRMRFYYTGGSGTFDASTGLGCVDSKQEVYFDVTPDQKQFDLYTFLHSTEGTIHLQVTALDENDNELYGSVFDVPMKRNQITWLSGDYFHSSNSYSPMDVTVTVNTDWAGEIHLTF